MRRSADQFEALARRTAPQLLGYATRRVEQRADAADVVAEVFLIAWRRVESIPTSDEDAIRWLYGVARRVVANQRRGKLRRHALAERLRGQLAASGPQDPVGLDPVHEAFAALPEADREILALHAWEGLSASEAAEVLGIRSAAARKRLERARRRIAAALADAPDGPTSDRERILERGEDVVGTGRA